MRKLMILAALLAASAVFIQTARYCMPMPEALAQTRVQDGQSTRGVQQMSLGGGIVRADSSGKAFTMSSTGGLSTYDEDRDRNYYRTWPAGQVISKESIAIGAADSNETPITVAPYRYLKLLIKCTPLAQGGVDTTSIVRTIWQFRECLNGNTDSTSLFPDYGNSGLEGQSTFGVSANGADTTLAGHLLRGNAGSPWSGEYVIEFHANRNAPASAVAVNGRLFHYPNGVGIMLDELLGHPTRFAKLQIRVRNAGSNTTAGSSAIKLDVSMIGFAQ